MCCLGYGSELILRTAYDCVQMYLLLCSRLESDASSMSENNDEDYDDEGGDDGHHQVTSALQNAQDYPGCQSQSESQISFLKCFFDVPLLATYISFFSE